MGKYLHSHKQSQVEGLQWMSFDAQEGFVWLVIAKERPNDDLDMTVAETLKGERFIRNIWSNHFHEWKRHLMVHRFLQGDILQEDHHHCQILKGR